MIDFMKMDFNILKTNDFMCQRFTCITIFQKG